MEFQAVEFDTKDLHDQLAPWWESFGEKAVPVAMLPPKGWAIYGADSILYCAGFVFETNGGFCLLDSVVSNPEVEKSIRREALAVLVPALIAAAKEKKFSTIAAIVDAEKHPKLTALYNKVGVKPVKLGTICVGRF